MSKPAEIWISMLFRLGAPTNQGDKRSRRLALVVGAALAVVGQPIWADSTSLIAPIDPTGRLERSPDALIESGIRQGNVEKINAALSQNANPNATDPNGKTALMVAAKLGDRKLVSTLLERGADPKARNHNGGTPLMFAAINGDVAIINALIDRNADVDFKGSNGWGALMIAVSKGHLPAVKRILEEGANVNTRDVYRWTPIHRAAYEGRLAVVRHLVATKDVVLDARDDQGATALHHAAARGYDKLVALLLNSGADAGIRDSAGRTPAFYADRQGYAKLALTLQRANAQFN